MERVGRILRIGCALSLSVHFGCAGEPYAIPAHWVEGSGVLEPRRLQFQFTDLSFSSPTHGWIAGQSYFLRVSGEDVQLTFVGDSPSSWTVAAPSDAEAWAGSSTSPYDDLPVLWHYSEPEHSWRPVDLRALDLRDTSIQKLRFESPTRGWALLSYLPPRAAIPSSSFLHFDGATWSSVRAGTAKPTPKLNDMCVDASGSGWAVGGVPGSEPRSWRGVVLRKEGLTWREVEQLPPVAGSAWDLYHVACLDGGGMVSSGVVASAEGSDLGKSFLLSYDGSWHRVPLPEPYDRYSPGALAVASKNEIWLEAMKSTGERDWHPTFVRFAGGQWSEVPFPALPRVSNFPLPATPTWMGGVLIDGMQFVSPDEAWAVGTKHHGGGEWRGLILHYEDGAWRNRNWNWHFWRERWFGLFAS